MPDPRNALTISASELMARIAAGEIDPVEHLRTQCEFARRMDEYLNAFIELPESPEPEIETVQSRTNGDGGSGAFAGQADPEMLRGRRHLTGVPVSVKDIFTARGFCATAGSPILEGYRPPYDATVVARTRAAGNFVVGKTNLDEFAMGSSTETSAYGACRNPWDLGRVPGGSSGGGAASVAACQAAIGWGTDTGGSVRQPAALCGVVGYKPTYGLLSRFGLIAYASSLDSPSIFAKCALDVALLLNAVCYPDALDSTCSVPSPVPDFVAESDPVYAKKPRIGVIKELTDTKLLHSGVAVQLWSAIERMKSAGAEITEISFPMWDITLPAYYIMTTAECSSNLARFDGVRYGPDGHTDKGLMAMYLSRRGGERGFGEETKRRILLGTYVLSAGYHDAYYNKARALRRAITAEVARLCGEYDALVCPTTLDPAFQIGERMEDPVQMYMSDIATVIANLAGTCAISLPCGLVPAKRSIMAREDPLSKDAIAIGVTPELQNLCRNDKGEIELPVGFQMIGARYRDAKLLSLARWFEETTGYGYKIPPIALKMLAT
ncbi:MAG: Asp-tRNA(Asn)/Glu-tRNA(Gln) amidotransferase subunit GatA [bacterium]